jgi:hypothetical protein
MGVTKEKVYMTFKYYSEKVLPKLLWFKPSKVYYEWGEFRRNGSYPREELWRYADTGKEISVFAYYRLRQMEDEKHLRNLHRDYLLSEDGTHNGQPIKVLKDV